VSARRRLHLRSIWRHDHADVAFVISRLQAYNSCTSFTDILARRAGLDRRMSCGFTDDFGQTVPPAPVALVHAQCFGWHLDSCASPSPCTPDLRLPRLISRQPHHAVHFEIVAVFRPALTVRRRARPPVVARLDASRGTPWRAPGRIHFPGHPSINQLARLGNTKSRTELFRGARPKDPHDFRSGRVVRSARSSGHARIGAWRRSGAVRGARRQSTCVCPRRPVRAGDRLTEGPVNPHEFCGSRAGAGRNICE